MRLRSGFARLMPLAVVAVLNLALQPPASAQATTTTTNETGEAFIIDFVPCANDGVGEFVIGGGPVHILIHSTISNSGNMLMTLHVNAQDVKAQGHETGDIYEVTGGSQETEILRATKGSEFSFQNTFRLIGPGPDNNLVLRDTIHVTINANGVITATMSDSTIECD